MILRYIYLSLLLFFSAISIEVVAQENTQKTPLIIREQGSFMAGGTVITSPEGNTFHGDHAYIFYQVPVNAKKYPLVFLHGTGQFSKTWQTTPDGREGFQNIFLRRGFSTYLIDQPRRGNAGRSTKPVTINPVPDEQLWFNRFRVGEWPNYFDGVQFSKDKEVLNQYFRQMTPNTGPMDLKMVSDAVAATFDKTGEGILVVHSQGGANGWLSLPKSKNIKAIVAYEPGGYYTFPEGEEPERRMTPIGNPESISVPLDEFKRFTEIPIIIYYADFLPDKPSGNPELDEWGYRLKLARQWAEVVNKRGGDVTVVHLPEIGIKGNTHFPFSDLNNVQIADLLSTWLKEKKLD